KERLGKLGRSGVRGDKGSPGSEGPQGEPGESDSAGSLFHSAFSVARGTASPPEKASPIRFTSVITDVNKDYNTETGRFRKVKIMLCTPRLTVLSMLRARTAAFNVSRRTPGGSLRSLSLFLSSYFLLPSPAPLPLLPLSSPLQVSSGGLATYLKKDQEVWLETNDYNGMTGKPEGNSLFSGFLLYSH
uniref:complement C1q subcomponent subunit C-like n=1 Tax=Oncorhynchus gorbuscha TaxID=8017 RepID=UPI001EAF87D6